jgi:hypothetical protein
MRVPVTQPPGGAPTSGRRSETGLYPALERQAARLGFADLLSIGDEPEQVLGRFPAVTTPPTRDGTPPEMLVSLTRNARRR